MPLSRPVAHDRLRARSGHDLSGAINRWGAAMLIKCPECQHDVSDTAPACPNCGYIFAAPAAPASAPTVEHTPAPTPAGLISTEKQILIEQRVTNEGPSAGVAYLLWFFLGLVSGHRFYLGRPGSALLQIATYFFLVGFLWLLLDGFLIPGMLREKRDEIRQRLTIQALAA
jgi:TM2 domain-containing membrane protein YozV